MTTDALQAYDQDALRALGLMPERLPRHVAIIMDGNGRWARKRGWRRVRGHAQGAHTVRTVTTECARLGIDYLTLYAFSSENWARPQSEIDYLMGLLSDYLDEDLPTLHENDIRFQVIGQLDRLPVSVRSRAERNIRETAGHQGLTMSLALSYGGRDEIVDACRRVAELVQAGQLEPADVDAAIVGGSLYDPDAPDVDLLIRSAGEQRVSNFLIWQSVYAEYVSVEPCWPEFDTDTLLAALREYQGRERSFGKV